MAAPEEQHPTHAVDTRPLWQVVMTHGRRPFITFALVLASVYIAAGEPPAGLGVYGQRSWALFICCIGLWITNALPLSITSLLAIALLPYCTGLTREESYALFGNEAVFFILGALIFAAALGESGLSRRLAVAVLRFTPGSSRNLPLGVLLATGGLSLLIIEHAVAALFLPVVAMVIKTLELPKGTRAAKALVLSVVWGCAIGGIGTFLGGARNPLAVAIMYERTGESFGFFEWAIAAAPLVAALLLVAAMLLRVIQRGEVSAAPGRLAELLDEERVKLGRLSVVELGVIAVGLATLAVLITGSDDYGVAGPIMVGCVFLFVFGLISWQSLSRYIDVRILLMYGGAISLGAGLDHTGAAAWLVDAIIGDYTPQAGFVLFLVVTLVTMILTELMSNAAVVVLLLPIALAFAEASGMHVKLLTLAIALPSGLAFTMPIASPVTALAFSTGHLRVADTIKPGLVFLVVASVLTALLAVTWWPYLGY